MRKRNIFNIFSSVISSVAILLLVSFGFIEKLEEDPLDKKSSIPLPDQVKRQEKSPEPKKMEATSITLPLPPPAPAPGKKNNSSKILRKVTPLKPNKPKRQMAETKKFKRLKPTSKTADKNTFLIKPIKPSNDRKKMKLAVTKLKSIPRQRMITKQINSSGSNKLLKRNILRTKETNHRATINREVSNSSNVHTRKNLTAGRVLLKILEHGSGPNIDFAWPDTEVERDRLFSLLRECYGMQVALMDQNKRLFRQSDASGQPWLVDMDRISGFTRLAGGKLTRFERKIIKQTQQKHSHINLITPVRMFPRNFDGGLLGELSYFMKKNISGPQSISAQYHQNGQNLYLKDIRINGLKVNGKINLSAYSRCRSGRRII